MTSVLIIINENPEYIQSLLDESLYLAPLIVDIALTISDGVKLLKKSTYDVILLDTILPNGGGVSMYNKIQDISDKTPIIVITEYEDKALDLVKAGAQDHHIRSTLTATQLNKSIQYAINRKKIERRLCDEIKNSDVLTNFINISLNSTQDIIWSTDSMNRYTIVNKSFLDCFKVRKNEILGKTIMNGINSLNYKSDNYNKLIILSKVPHNCIERVILTDNTEIWLDATRSPIILNDMVVGIVGIARNITDDIKERHRIEKMVNKEILIWNDAMAKDIIEIREMISDTENTIHNYKERLNEYIR